MCDFMKGTNLQGEPKGKVYGFAVIQGIAGSIGLSMAKPVLAGG